MKKNILFRHIFSIIFLIIISAFLVGCGSKNKEVVIQDRKEEGDFKLIKVKNKWYISGLIDEEKEEVVIPSTLDISGIWEKAFCDKQVYWPPEGGKKYLKNNNTLRKITIEKEIEKIGDYAFYECKALTEIIMPNTITEIGNYAFYECDKFEKIDFNNITKIGDHAFEKTSINSPAFSEKIKTIGENAFTACSEIEKVIMPSSIKKIGECCFSYCPNIKEVCLSECKKLTVLNGGMFSECSKLNKVLLPPKIKTIGSYAFGADISLKAIELPDSLTRIEEGAFDRTSLEKITIPKRVRFIGGLAFSCAPLTMVIILGRVKKMSSYSFSYNPEKTNLKIYYKGSESSWNKIQYYTYKSVNFERIEVIDYEHYYINKIEKVFYSSKKPKNNFDKYWHFVEGLVVVWQEED